MEILLAEAKSKWVAEVKRTLIAEGHRVKVTHSGRTVEAAIKQNEFDLVVIGQGLKHREASQIFHMAMKWADDPKRSLPRLLLADDLQRNHVVKPTVRCFFLPMRSAAELHAIINDILYSDQRQQKRVSLNRMATLTFEELSAECTVNDVSTSGISIIVPRRRLDRLPLVEGYCSLVVFLDSWATAIGTLGALEPAGQSFWMDGLIHSESPAHRPEQSNELEVLRATGIFKRIVVYKQFLRSHVLLGIQFINLNDTQTRQIEELIATSRS
ncbi:MAG: hypothetical protein A2289_05700 [Deltaproteobacteria bacterium RIFOXYA12_FULL_58_15]|nr:MAG: hypothetical protein A2289_05700 [Deltaproteobacteria bacterium RIFOXYA12_FULL_58_15]